MISLGLFVFVALLAQGWSQPSVGLDPENGNNHMAREAEGSLEPRVVGGQPAKSAPYMAALTLTNSSVFCGAAVLAERWVVTAAHCVMYDIELVVAVGTHHLGKGGDTHEIEKIKMHKYDKVTRVHDIALVKTKTPIAFNSKVKPVKLPTAEPTAGTKCQLYGWGKIEDGTFATELLTVTLKVIDRQECQGYLGNALTLSDGMVCSLGKKGLSACSGDSGGPLMDGDTLVGLMSFGVVDSCVKGYPDIHTKFHHYLSWIHENMK